MSLWIIYPLLNGHIFVAHCMDRYDRARSAAVIDGSESADVFIFPSTIWLDHDSLPTLGLMQSVHDFLPTAQLSYLTEIGQFSLGSFQQNVITICNRSLVNVLVKFPLNWPVLSLQLALPKSQLEFIIALLPLLFTGTTTTPHDACSGTKVIGDFSSRSTWQNRKWWNLWSRDKSSEVSDTSDLTSSTLTVTSPDLVKTGKAGTLHKTRQQYKHWYCVLCIRCDL